MSENCMDPGSVRGDGHNLEVEEGVGKKSSIDDDRIENSTNESFGEDKNSEMFMEHESFPCGLCPQTLKTVKAL